MAEDRELIERFGQAVGWPWIPVRFCYEVPKDEPRRLRFCEAVREAARTPIVLTRPSVTCIGARRSFGWALGLDEGLAEDVAVRQALPLAAAKKMLKAVPRLNGDFVAVEVGTRDTPDVLLSYAQPPTAMKIARALERSSGEPFTPIVSSVMSVCGNGAVRSFLSGNVTVSFGCQQSRESASIGRDRMVVGVPWAQVEKLLDTVQ
jgi:uncharacterized protein (DUF169 family)